MTGPIVLSSLRVLFVIPVLGLPLVAQTGGGSTDHELRLTLDDAVRLALDNNIDLESEALSTEIARMNALGSWGSFDPLVGLTGTAREQEQEGQSQLSGGTVIENDSLDFDASLNYPLTTGGFFDASWIHSNDRTTNEFSLFDTSTSDVVTLSFTQPLLRGAWERYATTTQRERELDLQRQLAVESSVRKQLVLDVYSAYWDLVSARDQVSVRELAVKRAEEQQRQDERRRELGAGTDVDVLQSRTTVSQQNEQLLNALFQRHAAEDLLRRMLFQHVEGEIGEFLAEWDYPIIPLTPLPDPEEHDLDWRASLRLAIEKRPEVQQWQYEIQAAEVRLEAARSNRRPQLDLTLSTSSGGFDPDPDESFSEALGWDFPTHTASLDFSVPLRNRTARYAERAARASVRQARLGLDRQELTILAEVRAAVRDVTYTTQALSAANLSSELAQEQLDAEETRRDIGLSTTFQVLEFQETLAESRSTAVSAHAEYAKALVRLAHAEGSLDVALDGDE